MGEGFRDCGSSFRVRVFSLEQHETVFKVLEDISRH
jgi:hypothetical protein